MTSDKVKERIEKEALESADFYTIKSDPSHKSYLQGYINGSLVERPKAWNDAIDECYKTVVEHFRSEESPYVNLKDKFEKLKHKQP